MESTYFEKLGKSLECITRLSESWPSDCLAPIINGSPNQSDADDFTAQCNQAKYWIQTAKKMKSGMQLKHNHYDFLDCKSLTNAIDNGYMTLYVGGQHQSNIYRLLNALLGMPHLLPIGNQRMLDVAMCIECSDDQELCIKYGNGLKETIVGDVHPLLFDLVNIDKAYDRLPINHINRYLIQGKGRDFFLSDAFATSLQGTEYESLPAELLNDYIDSHPTGSIPVEITVRLPLPAEFKDWKIFIDDWYAYHRHETAEMDANARIYVYPAENEKVLECIAHIDKCIAHIDKCVLRKNNFYVIMDKADFTYSNTRESMMVKAKEKLPQTSERLYYVDCLPYLLAIDHHLDYKVAGKCIINREWDKASWNECLLLLSAVNDQLTQRGMIFNNGNISQLLNEYSGFNPFRLKLAEYLGYEKKFLFHNLYYLIYSFLYSNMESKRLEILSMENQLGLDQCSLMSMARVTKELNAFKIEYAEDLYKLVSFQTLHTPENIVKDEVRLEDYYAFEDCTMIANFSQATERAKHNKSIFFGFIHSLSFKIINEVELLAQRFPSYAVKINKLKDLFDKMQHDTLESIVENHFDESTIIEPVYYHKQSVQNLLMEYLTKNVSSEISSLVHELLESVKDEMQRKYRYTALWLNLQGNSPWILQLMEDYYILEKVVLQLEKLAFACYHV